MSDTFRVGDRVAWQQLEARPDKARGRSWHSFERLGTVTELYRDPPWCPMARLTLDSPVMVTATAGTGESVTESRTDVRVRESSLRARPSR